MTEEENWFNRADKGIKTPIQDKKDTPKGIWVKVPKDGGIVESKVLKANHHVDPNSGHHFNISSADYFDIFFDGDFKELDKDIESLDPLVFEDNKKYKDRLEQAKQKTKLKDAIRTAVGKSMGNDLVVACMDFAFIGGSMGSVVGEKICRAIDHAIAHRLPVVIISKSGGARMMEAPYSLMQMVRTTAKLSELAAVGLPYISLCTNPTTGGVTASYAMLGDINIAEPESLIAFAGPRVVKETMKGEGRDEEIPADFQTAEYLFNNGFLDFIVHRKDLKKKVNLFLDLIANRPVRV